MSSNHDQWQKRVCNTTHLDKSPRGRLYKCVFTKHCFVSWPQARRYLLPKNSLVQYLFRLGQADGTVANVVHGVPLAQESVTQDGKRAHGLREVHAHEGADAGALDLKGVVVGADGEVVAAQGEGQVRQRVTLVTLDRVLSSEALGGTDLLVTK